MYEANPGPRELLERILAQVKVAKRVSDAAKTQEEEALLASGFLSKASKVDGDSLPCPVSTAGTGAGSGFARTEATRLVDFCDTIVKAVLQIDKALRQSKNGVAVLHGMSMKDRVEESNVELISDEELQKRYETWAKDMGYGHSSWLLPSVPGVDNDATLSLTYKHAYSKEAQAVTSYAARNTALMKEVGRPLLINDFCIIYITKYIDSTLLYRLLYLLVGDPLFFF